jgi:large subunit ribosomal protein L19
MNTMSLIDTMLKERAVEARRTKDGDNYTEIPEFRSGDTVNIAVRVVEGEKERIQNFKGIVLGRHGHGVNQTFLIRKVSNGVGVERVFSLFTPMIQSITVLRKGNTRRSKLYYLRGMSERKIRQKIN